MSVSIVLLGAGRVATHLGLRLAACHYTLLQVYNRHLVHAEALAQQLHATATDQLSALRTDADLYILAISDAALPEMAAALRAYLPPAALVVHTSGATPGSVLAPHFAHYGVFYPVQTFTTGRAVNWPQVPFCLAAAQPTDLALLQTLAAALGGPHYVLDDQQRAVLHLAAVFVNNFTNYLYHIGHDILQENDLPFELLLPLIEETAQKVQTITPAAAQTGPALRGDKATIARHLAYLQSHPQWAAAYRVMTAGLEK